MLLLLHYPPSPTTLFPVLLSSSSFVYSFLFSFSYEKYNSNSRSTRFYSILFIKHRIKTSYLLVFIKLVISFSLSLLFFAAFRFFGPLFPFSPLLLLLPLPELLILRLLVEEPFLCIRLYRFLFSKNGR